MPGPGHLPGSVSRRTAAGNILEDDVELDVVESHAGTPSLQGGTSQASFPSLRTSLREPLDSDEIDDERRPLTPQVAPSSHGAQASTYSEIPHLGPEEGEALNAARHARPTAVYYFKRYIPRALLNVLAPLLILGFYLFIVGQYFQRPAINGIIPSRPLDANAVFFAWLILSIFVLDWAKSGIAGFEAAALMTPSLAPSNARQLMWHADRAWGSVSSWCEVVVVAVEYVYKKLTSRRGTLVEWTGPGLLWFYLAFSSILFYVTVPLSGLTMEPENALRLGTRPVVLTGVNQTTFDGRVSNDLAEQVDGRWRQGNPTTPHGSAIFYASEGTQDVSDDYFEDTVQSIYYKQEINGSLSPEESRFTFFAGPELTERAYGTAWGFLTDLSCTPVHPYKGLELLQINEINNWTAKPAYASSLSYGNNETTFQYEQQHSGYEAVFFDKSEVTGLSYQYVMAANSDTLETTSVYTNKTGLPLNGTLELVMWQARDNSSSAPLASFGPDATFSNMSNNPIVVSSKSIYDNQTYLGYGVRCKAITTTGRAKLSAMTNTFSSFQQEPPDADNSHFSGLVALATGVVGLHTLVYSAFTATPLAYMGPPKCGKGSSATCNGWVGANKATRAAPIWRADDVDVRYPTISPARMTLALNKLFGEGAVAMMAVGPGNWTSTPNATSKLGLFALDPANDVVPGRVPYGFVIALLTIWAFVTVLPQLWPAFLYGRRWGDTLDGFAMFRLGAEWKSAVHELESDEFWSTGAASLRKVPGMIGDMRPRHGEGKLRDGIDGGVYGVNKIGFVGLSHHRAEADSPRLYTYNSL
ncbi:hypothetical protein F5Y17DRAFT_390650 [Xylariaceae sp. FL0594]|nr:hypothetical protein F5Y17DRAFT_390650 [Xylariaceae sp. FL0594]